MFRSRGFRLPSGSILPLKDIPSIDELRAYGADVINTTEAQLLLNDLAFVSGEIPRVTSFEHGLPGHYRRTGDGALWEPDETVTDERFLAVDVAGKGIVVFTACSHAGVVNVLKHARTCFGDFRLYAVVGGLHLAGITEQIIPDTVEAMREFDLSVVAAGHCTGWRAITALANTFGEGRLVPLSVGQRLSF